MIELTDDQAQAVEANREAPPRVLNPRTGERFVLIRQDVYEQLRGLLGQDIDPSEAYPAIDRAFAAGWDDPKMDDYDHYNELRQ